MNIRKLFIVSGLLAFSTVNAQWTIEPEVKVGVERDDNAKLSTRTDDILGVTGTHYGGEVRASYQSELSDFYIEPRLVSRNYDDAEEIDSNDFFLESTYRRNTESSIFRFRVDYEDQSARTAERSDVDLDVDDPGDIPDDDTGLVRFEGKRQRLRLRPEWIYDFNEVSSMDMALNYLDVGYEDELQLVLDEFTDARFEIGYNRAFSERTIGMIRGAARRFRVSESDVETDGYGIMAGFERLLNETTRARVLVGLEDTDSTITEADPEFVADISIRRRGETINSLAQYRRTISASGTGKLSVRDSVNMNLSRRLNERITAGIGARLYQTNSLDDTQTSNERNYVQLRAQFVWSITTAIAAEVDYRYTFQKRAALEESANSNQVLVWFVYRPNSIDRRFDRDLDL